MCQILFAKTKNPEIDVLEYANESNSHGFGYAWVEGGAVKWSKGYESKDLKDHAQRWLDLPFPKAIHFRWATHGGITPELTHPFPIKRGNPLTLSGDAKSVLFHNGIWHSWDDRLLEGILGGTINPNIMRTPMSDSRAMAVLAQRFGVDVLDLLNIHSQKVLVLSHDTWYTYGTWVDRDGWSASNSKLSRPIIHQGNFSISVPKDKRKLRYVEVVGEGGKYLDSSREEVEENLLIWNRNQMGA